jgi:hypothetical protein
VFVPRSPPNASIAASIKRWSLRERPTAAAASFPTVPTAADAFLPLHCSATRQLQPRFLHRTPEQLGSLHRRSDRGMVSYQVLESLRRLQLQLGSSPDHSRGRSSLPQLRRALSPAAAGGLAAASLNPCSCLSCLLLPTAVAALPPATRRLQLSSSKRVRNLAVCSSSKSTVSAGCFLLQYHVPPSDPTTAFSQQLPAEHFLTVARSGTPFSVDSHVLCWLSPPQQFHS